MSRVVKASVYDKVLFGLGMYGFAYELIHSTLVMLEDPHYLWTWKRVTGLPLSASIVTVSPSIVTS